MSDHGIRFYNADNPVALTFDDVLLVPGESDVLPRDVLLNTRFSRNVRLTVPLASAAMDTVTHARLAAEMARLGGIGVLHKNMSPKAQADAVRSVKQQGLTVAAAVGAAVHNGEDDRVRRLVEAGVDVIVVDSAHGHSKGVLDRVAWVKQSFPSVDVVGGNVATAAAALALYNAGADGVKVGIGPGSICTTRIVAGVGVPQVSAIADVASALSDTSVTVIADGGIRYSGDIAKAIVAGASSCMLGSMFAGTDEAPGVVEYYGGQGYKCYRGMGSMGAMSGDLDGTAVNTGTGTGSADRYFQAGIAQSKLVPEGIEGRVLCKGPLNGVVDQLMGGLRSAMGYTGCGDIRQMQTVPQFVRITTAGMKESHVHDVTITKEAPNYRI